VEAELYSANHIENYDTCAMRITLEGGACLLVYMTHACSGAAYGTIRISGTNGSLQMGDGHPLRIITASGVEQMGGESRPSLDNMVRGFCSWTRGDRAQIVSTLEGARAHTLVISGASDATAVQTINSSNIQMIRNETGSIQRVIPGIRELCRDCAERGELLHESKRAPWSQPGGITNLREYNHFSGNLLPAK
jgi:hypothetical protein